MCQRIAFYSVVVLLMEIVFAENLAQAAPPFCRVDLDYTSTSMTCDGLLSCSTPGSCAEGKCDLDVEQGLCLLVEESLFCCAGCQCPTLGSEDGTCLPVGPNGICLYPNTFEYCSASPSFAQVEACYTQPGGVRTRDYAEGDCDADGVANGVDSAVCPAGTYPDAGLPDGSPVPSVVDAGTATADAEGEDISVDDDASASGNGETEGANAGGCAAGGQGGGRFGLLLLLAMAWLRRRR